MSAHQHQWSWVSHMDGCHWFSSVATCPCGAQYYVRAERDKADDPYSEVWFSSACERCRELAAGAKPAPDVFEVSGGKSDA